MGGAEGEPRAPLAPLPPTVGSMSAQGGQLDPRLSSGPQAGLPGRASRAYCISSVPWDSKHLGLWLGPHWRAEIQQESKDKNSTKLSEMFCGGGQHQDPALGRADHPEGLWPASPSPSGHPKSRDVGKEPRGSAFTQLLGPRQPRLWGKAWSRGTRAHPPDAGRLPKHEDFQSPLKSHLELSPGIKPGLSLVRFSISAPACFSKKFFKGSGRSF